MNRRGFLGSCLAAGVAPYVCTAAGVLMPVRKALSLGEPLTIGLPTFSRETVAMVVDYEHIIRNVKIYSRCLTNEELMAVTQ